MRDLKPLSAVLSLIQCLAVGALSTLQLVKVQEQRHKCEVVVVCTSTPERVNNSLEAVVDSIFGQSVLPDLFVLSLPRGRMKNRDAHWPEDSDLPMFLQKPRKKVLVDRDCEDMGPGTHIYNGLKYAKRQDAFVIIIHDDHIFSEHHIAILLAHAMSENNQGAAIGAVGLNSQPEFSLCSETPGVQNEICVGKRNLGATAGPMILSFMGQVVRPWFFAKPFVLSQPSPAWPSECNYQDDLWIAATLARQGLQRRSGDFGLPEKAIRLPATADAVQQTSGRWTLQVCSDALNNRFPGLWVPRPRLILFGFNKAASSCLGHVDRFRKLSKLVARLNLGQVKRWVKHMTRFEHRDAVALFQVGGTCQTLSAVLQCAIQNPGAEQQAIVQSGAVCVIREGAPLAAAAAVGMWRDGAPVVVARQQRSCWTLPNATWGRCCARYGESLWLEPSGRRSHLQSLARKLVENNGFKPWIWGCPAYDTCCVTDSRLQNRWRSFSGHWDLEYDDGKRFTAWLSEGGLVHLDGQSKPPEFRLEETASPSMARLRRIGSAVFTSGSGESLEAEHWVFTQGEIALLVTGPKGQLSTGRGVAKGDCVGCV